MTTRNWIGIGFALLILALFGLYITKHEITGAVGLVFGGGLLFAGMLIDPAEFKSLLGLLPFRRPE